VIRKPENLSAELGTVTFAGEVSGLADDYTCLDPSCTRDLVLPHLAVVQCAMLTALAVVLGHALAAVPNIELVTLTVFIAGLHAGPMGGIITALTTTVYFNYLNPAGQVLLPVLVGQGMGWSVVALAGARFGRRRRSWVAWCLAGAIVTVIYQAVVNGAYVWLCCPVASWTERAAVLMAGLSFSVVHVVGNTAIFGFLGDSLVRVIRR